ncbi:protein FAM228B isoform X1 [Pelodiscus sinensis]|uniref:protein FAM228B isoform X1 n=1 Tax=Pelodiscus sinensis TaxID=13735 RepID=UPI003F6BAB3D
MEATGSTAAQQGRVPSVPSPSLDPQDPARPDSVTSIETRRKSLYEDWLIRVYCPGSQNKHDVQVLEQPVQGISPSVSKKIRTIRTLCKRKSSKDWLTWAPSTPLQPCSGVSNMDGSKNHWLLNLKCPRSQAEYDLQSPEQGAISSPARSTPPSTFGSSASERKKSCKHWLTQKRFSQVQAVSNEGQDIIAATQSILDRENYFVKEVDKYLRHRDFLELRRKEIQYKKWFEHVSQPLLQKIEDKVDSQSSEDIEERKRKQLTLYLNYYRNKKGKVVLDDYDPAEYDPLFLNTHATYLKVQFGFEMYSLIRAVAALKGSPSTPAEHLKLGRRRNCYIRQQTENTWGMNTADGMKIERVRRRKVQEKERFTRTLSGISCSKQTVVDLQVQSSWACLPPFAFSGELPSTFHISSAKLLPSTLQ